MFLKGDFDLDASIEITLHCDQIEDAGIDRKGDIPAVSD